MKTKKLNNDIEDGYCSVDVKTGLHKNGFRFIEKSKTKTHTSLSVKMSNFNSGDEIDAYISHALAIEWIRVNFNYFISVDVIGKESYYGEKNGKYIFTITKTQTGKIIFNSWGNVDDNIHPKPLYYNSPQEAADAALLYTLTNLIK